ncbi:AAA family ATPase [Hydrogenivirga sp.]
MTGRVLGLVFLAVAGTLLLFYGGVELLPKLTQRYGTDKVVIGLVLAFSVGFVVLLVAHANRVQKRAAVSEGEGKAEGRPPYGIEVGEVARELLSLSPDHFKHKVVGQDTAIEELVKGIKLGAQQLLKGNEKRERVLCSAIFVGATGVGKTETAKTLAEILKPLGYKFIRIDLNMYRDRASAWSLIGSPKGFIGSDEGGVLTRALMENPRAVILLDEMEKAHPDLHPIFMTMLDEGYIEEQSTGSKVYLDGAVVIFTSNHASREIASMVRSQKDKIALELSIRSMMERYFGRPEIIGRIDKIVPFKNLDEKDLEDIAGRVLAKYNMEGQAHVLTRKFLKVAQTYGVRMFVKKVEESALLGENPEEVSEEEDSPRKGKGIEIDL